MCIIFLSACFVLLMSLYWLLLSFHPWSIDVLSNSFIPQAIVYAATAMIGDKLDALFKKHSHTHATRATELGELGGVSPKCDRRCNPKNNYDFCCILLELVNPSHPIWLPGLCETTSVLVLIFRRLPTEPPACFLSLFVVDYALASLKIQFASIHPRIIEVRMHVLTPASWIVGFFYQACVLPCVHCWHGNIMPDSISLTNIHEEIFVVFDVGVAKFMSQHIEWSISVLSIPRLP